MNNREVVVTGATGHIGNRLVQKLIKRDYKVTALVRNKSLMSNFLTSLGAEVIICELLNEETYIEALSNKYAAFHLASENTTDINNENRTIENTYTITKKFINCCIKKKVEKIIYTSSVVVLGRSNNPKDLITIYDHEKNSNIPYVKGKIKAENWIRAQNNTKCDIRTVYPSWVVGPGDSRGTPPNKFIENLAKNNNLLSIRGGVSITHVDDVAEGHILALEKGNHHGRYLLSGHNISFKRLYKLVAEKFNRPNPLCALPSRPLKIIIRLLGKLSPINRLYADAIIGKYSWYNCDEAIKKINYNIRPLDNIFDDLEINIKQLINGTERLNYLPRTTKEEKNTGNSLLITGFPGWLGNRAVEILAKGGLEDKNKYYTEIKLLVQKQYIKFLPCLPEHFKIIPGDLSDVDSLNKALREVNIVWHMAGCIYPHKADTHYKVNSKGTENIINACINNNVRRVIYMSTDSVCSYSSSGRLFSDKEKGKPYKDYGNSKLKAERVLFKNNSQNKIDATVLRGFWFFGPNLPPRNKKFIKSFLWPFQIVFGNGKNYRSITHIDDVIHAFIKCQNEEKSYGKWYWIASLEEPQTVNSIYHMISIGLNTRLRLIHIPNYVCDCFSILDSIYSKITGNINATLLAAGKFHKNIATNKEGLSSSKDDFNWHPKVTIKRIQEELRQEIKNK